ncbi:MAG: zinc-binding alcohol dehydrogenase family protein [Verrucomicrobia bacterium]|nr:zinc-binding alcohol dehydrogenase family protein [Verrucomicrobiota bacterium]
MKQVILDQPGNFVLRDAAEPTPRPGEALLRIHRVGVCGSDLHAFRGRQPFFEYPRVPGHELGAEIVEVGPNDRELKAGDRVAVEPYLSCGRCRACRLGRPNCCRSMRVIGVHVDGGLCERFAAPVGNLHRSDSLSFDQLALVETLGIGAHAVARARLQRGEWAVVVGAGPIGLATIQFALAAGVQVIVVDISGERLTFVRRLGAQHVVNAQTAKPLDAIRELAGDDLADCVFDATGNPKSMETSFDFVGTCGRVVLVGLVQGCISFDDPAFHRRELTVLASRNSAGEFPRIIGMIERGEIDTRPWITHRLTLAEVPDRFERLADPGIGLIKAMIEV